MKTWLRNNARWAVPVGVILVVFGGWLIFGYFGFQTILFDDEVNEDVPVFASGAGPSGLASDELSDEGAEAMNQAMEDEATPTDAPIEDPMPEMAVETPEIIVQYQGPFQDRSHPAEGIAEVLNDGTDQRFLRFEEFSTDNGPDLNVYLATAPGDAPASEFGVDGQYIDLGDLKGNTGPQNYEIPADVDLDEFGTVVIWCVRFGVAFGTAEIGPT